MAFKNYTKYLYSASVWIECEKCFRFLSRICSLVLLPMGKLTQVKVLRCYCHFSQVFLTHPSQPAGEHLRQYLVRSRHIILVKLLAMYLTEL